MSKRALVVLTLLAALLAPVAASAEDASAARKKTRLKAFKSCNGLVSYARRNAPRTIVPSMGRPMPADGAPRQGSPGTQEGAAGAPAPAAGGTDSAAPDYSTTNVQEEGVDEPDTVKTDGKTIFAVNLQSLHAVDARATEPRLVGSLDLGRTTYGHQLLLRGNRLLVIGQGSVPLEEMPGPARASSSSSVPASSHRALTVLTEVDVSDPTAMKVVRTLEVEGYHVTSRLNGSTARLVLNTPPRALDFAGGQEDLPAMRRQARRARLASWMPHARLTHKPTGRTLERKVVGCRSVRHAPTFSGVDMLTVATIDIDRGLHILDSDAVMTSAETVYGSTKNLYVATQNWLRQDAAPARIEARDTLIHKFSLTDSENTTYEASGEVPGHLLSQWSMSERGGHLRVASTTWPVWLFGDRPEIESESYVTVLEQREGRLVQTGRVGGLGKGERIWAVRFIDDIGYVVTFRQVDPLYTVDVSDPARPRVRGELKIMGYSAYLHPIGKDLLLGVGQDATEEGRRLGTQLSVFDVSDLENPRRLHQASLGDNSYSAAEFDHHAFLYWPQSKLAVLPLAIWDEQSHFAGAAGFRVDKEGGISEVGRIQHEPRGDYLPMVERSLVMGDRLVTLSMFGLKTSRLDTLADEGWVAFPQPAMQGHPEPAGGGTAGG